jgi:hypothetical protein
MKKIFLFIIFILLVITLTNCKKDTLNQTTVTINTDEYILTTNYIFINETILSLLNQEHAVILVNIKNSSYISCINDLCAGKNKYWSFCQNNDCYNNNPNKVTIKNNSMIRLYTYNLEKLSKEMNQLYNKTN